MIVAALMASRPVAADTAGDLLSLPVRRGDERAASLGARLGGSPAVVVFWASYCPPCRAEVPVLRRIAARWREAGVRVVGIALDVDDAADASRLAREWNYETLWLPADAWDRAGRLAPAGLPVVFFVPAGGKIVREDRALTERDLDALGERLGLDRLPRAAGR